MRHPRPRPKLLHEKLRAIREFLNLGQLDLAQQIETEIIAHSCRHDQIQPSRIWEYENGKREPSLLVLIAYIHLGQLHLESLVDDGVDIGTFRRRLGKEFDHGTLTRMS